MNHIVITDGHALNPGDLNWRPLEALGTVEVHGQTDASHILERCRQATIVLTNKVPFPRETLDQLPLLRHIAVTATGYNLVDIDACRQRGISVSNVPSYGTHAVAEFVFALLFELTRRVGRHSDSVHRGDWSRHSSFCYTLTPQAELHGKTMGILGWGRIGRQVGRIAAALGMRILGHSRSRLDPLTDADFAWASPGELFVRSDVLSLHCPLTAETRHIIRGETLAQMKPTAFLINTARGPLVCEPDLARALKERRLAGAALDVLEQEPPAKGSPLFGIETCLITPHMAWTPVETRQRLLDQVIDNVRAFAAGSPINNVAATA